MANEGSTKPTYSELEARVRELESLPKEWEGSGYSPQQMGRLVLEYRARQADVRTLSAELARVRGLLQRQSEVLQRVASWDFDFYGDCVAEAKKLASDALSQQNSSAVVQSSGRCGDCDHLHRDHGGFNAQCTNGGHGKPRCQCLGFTER